MQRACIRIKCKDICLLFSSESKGICPQRAFCLRSSGKCTFTEITRLLPSDLDLKPFYSGDFDIWMTMPDWELQQSISRHCTVALDEFQVMVIGGGSSVTWNTSMILDVRTGIWTKTEPILTPRYAHACLLTEVNGVVGVMVTGKNDHVIDRKQIQLFVKYKRYHLQ